MPPRTRITPVARPWILWPRPVWSTDGRPHHWQNGPQNLVRKRGGRFTARWWLLNAAPLTKTRFRQFFNSVVRDEQGWRAAGVDVVETSDWHKAHFVVAVATTTACGGSPGCFLVPPPDRAGLHFGTGGLPHLELDYGLFAGKFPGLLTAVVLLHELGHALFSMHEMYRPSLDHPEPHDVAHYVGVMGTPQAGERSQLWPSPLEIDSARRWLRGEALHVHEHH